MRGTIYEYYSGGYKAYCSSLTGNNGSGKMMLMKCFSPKEKVHKFLRKYHVES